MGSLLSGSNHCRLFESKIARFARTSKFTENQDKLEPYEISVNHIGEDLF